MIGLLGSAHEMQILLLAIFVIFVVVPLLFRLLLKLFEPRPDGSLPIGLGRRRRERNNDWGAEDAAHVRRVKYGSDLPHQRGRRSRPR